MDLEYLEYEVLRDLTRAARVQRVLEYGDSSVPYADIINDHFDIKEIL